MHKTLAVVQIAHLRVCQATSWQWRNNSIHFKYWQTSLLYTTDRYCAWKINHSRGGLDGYGVSVMPRWERKRCSGQVWIHRDESWKKELNITTRRGFLTETAPVLLGCWSALSTELCCHTVVHLFNYIMKVTPAECVVTDVRHWEKKHFKAVTFLLSEKRNTWQVRQTTTLISLCLLVIYCMYTP